MSDTAKESGKRRTWVEMHNGEILSLLPFIVIYRDAQGQEVIQEFDVSNPPIFHGDANLFSRVSFETIRDRFKLWGFPVSHIIRGESSERSVRDCYVFAPGARVPFAIVRPAVFFHRR